MSLRPRVLRRSGPQDRLLVLFHGYAMGPASLLRHVERFDPDANYFAVAPRAPFRNGDGKPIWFEPLTRRGSHEQITAAVELADAFVGETCVEFGCRRSEVVLGGFSQGSALACAVALRRARAARPAGCLAWCGLLVLPGVEYDWDAAVEFPVHLQAGTRDDILPIHVARAGALELHARGAALEYREYDCGHELPVAGRTSAARWLQELHRGADLPGDTDLDMRLADAPDIDEIWSALRAARREESA